MFALQRRSADGGEWKTVRENVVDFGIQGDFLYASVYKDVNPDTVGFFWIVHKPVTEAHGGCV